MATSSRPFGDHLREWRQRRRMSQLDLALEADISSRHLSFVETGRSQPSREMVLHLSDRLEIPLRERNLLLISAGYAPVFPERRLEDPALQPARRAMDLVLSVHEPYPALAVDRHWTLVAASLLAPPVNVLRLGLHPDGLAPRILNLPEWRQHLLERLRHQIDLTADPTLIGLLDELRSYSLPHRQEPKRSGPDEYGGVVVPLRLATEHGTLALFSTITVFGTPVDVTLSELALESFFPADAETGEILRRLCPPSRSE